MTIIQPDSNAQLWDLFLTNNGKFGAFEIDSSTYPFTNGGHTYYCAILITEEDTGWFDENCIFWVEKGIVIADKVSLRKDIEDSANELGISPSYYECGVHTVTSKDPCKIDGTYDTCGGTSIKYGGDGSTTDVFETKFAGDFIDYCDNCSFAESNTTYRPKKALKCTINPYTGKGMWQEVEVGG